ncbi:MAG: hypothetical protein Q7N50_05885 [Armatimonadota bacterium]|nr:hypothetical protein [Armatimonadota bacterium]
MRDLLALAQSAKSRTRQTFSSVSHPRLIYLPARNELQQRGFDIVGDFSCALERGDDLAGFIGLLAGVLKRENLLSYSRRKVDKNELIFVEKVVLPTLVYDPYKIVLGCPRIRQNSIDFTEDQRGFVPGILDTQRKWFRRLLHFSSKYSLILKSLLPMP